MSVETTARAAYNHAIENNQRLSISYPKGELPVIVCMDDDIYHQLLEHSPLFRIPAYHGK